MKRLIIILGLIFLSACAAPQETAQPTNTPAPPTVTLTPAPTETPLPSSTPTPTPEPYLLEEGVLLDWDEEAGEYVAVSEGIDALITTDEGEIAAVDDDGSPRFVFENGDWIEIKIPEGTENHKQVDVQDRYVTIVNEEGKTEEVLESGIKVLVNPETGKYEYEFKNGQWTEYVPRVMVVGEGGWVNVISPIEVPKEVIETAAETVKNAEMFKRVIDGKMVELKTGLDEKWGELRTSKGVVFLQWYGVLCGTVERSNHLFALMGVEMNSGDILLINTLFHKIDIDYSGVSLVIEGEVMPNEYEAQLDTMKSLGRPIDANQIANALLKSPTGTPLYISMFVNGKYNKVEGIKIWDALKSGEFLGSADSSIFDPLVWGASDTFWDLAESQ